MNSSKIPDFKVIRSILLSKENTLRVSLDLLEKNVTSVRQDDLSIKMLRNWGELIIKQNVDEIFEKAESPIEKLFLNSILYFGLLYDTRAFIFTPRGAPITNRLFLYQINKSGMAGLKQLYRLRYPQKSDSEIEMDVLKSIEGTGDKDFYEMFLFHSVMYNRGDLKNSYHITLQAFLEDVELDGSRIRPDLTIWVPEKPQFRLVVECDGFKWHSGRKPFTLDRQKDRLLQQNGYMIHRYSGHEIFHNPIETGFDLCKYLFAQKIKPETPKRMSLES